MTFTAMTEDLTLVKTDCLGRVTVAKEQREKMLDAFEASSMSGAEFARTHGVPVMTFASWIQKRRKARGDYNNEEKRRELRMRKKSDSNQKPSAPQHEVMNLIEVTPQASMGSSELEIILPSGAKVQIKDESQIPLLKALIRELSC